MGRAKHDSHFRTIDMEFSPSLDDEGGRDWARLHAYDIQVRNLKDDTVRALTAQMSRTGRHRRMTDIFEDSVAYLAVAG